MNTKTIDTRLSYSSATLLKNCSQKYYYHKISTPGKDPDSEDNMEAFNVGKAFHWVLEENGHTEARLEELLEEAVQAYEVEDLKGMIHAMLLRYLKLHKESGLTCIKAELELSNDFFIGFIDAIMTDPEGGWWIVDLKTAGRFADTTLARLALDTQLNLYSSFSDDIALHLELDPDRFMGARYRCTTKSKLVRKATESYSDHVLRTAKNVKSYDVVIPITIMDPKTAIEEHKALHKDTLKMREGKAKPKKNLSYCDSFFRPCEYWSQCYGKTFTEWKGDLESIMLKSDNA